MGGVRVAGYALRDAGCEALVRRRTADGVRRMALGVEKRYLV